MHAGGSSKQALGVPANGTLSFGIGSVEENITLIVKSDTNQERNESLQINLTTPTAGAKIWPIDTYRYTIVNDDGFPAIETGVFRRELWQFYQ